MSGVGRTALESFLELDGLAFVLADRFARCGRRCEDGGEESGGDEGDEGESHCCWFGFGGD